MPTLTPTGVVFTISDLATEVIFKVENRSTDLSRAYIWLRDALIEISSNPDFRDEFCELEIIGPLFVLTGSTSLASSVQEYDESNIVPTGDVNAATLDIMIWIDPPTNTKRQKLNPGHYQEADKSVVTVGQPYEWYRFGTNIGFNLTPDQNYQVQARILRMHPIADNAVETTTILLPRDWNEVLVLSAAERGFIELNEYEKAGALHQLLHGDPKHPEEPGLLYSRKKKRLREAWRTSQGLRPVVPTYINK